MEELLRLWHYWQNVIIGHALQLLTLATGVAIVSLSPLGKGLLAAIRNRAKDRIVNDQLLAELEHLRGALGEVTERLDSTERLLKTQAESRWITGRPSAPEARSETNTPH